MPKMTTAPPTGAPAAPAQPQASREYPKVVYHLKKGAQKVMDAIEEAAAKAKGYTAAAPAPPKDPAEKDEE